MDKIILDVIESGMSLLEASVKYDVSVHKLRRYITSLKNSDNIDDINLYYSYVKRKEIDKKSIFIDIVCNDLTLEEASKKYNCSLSTIKKYIASLIDTDDEELAVLYKQYLKSASRHSHVSGGKAGIRVSAISDEIFEYVYGLIVEEGYTLREVEAATGIKKSTIYDLLTKNLNSDRKKILLEAFRKHKEFSKNDYNNDVENIYEFHVVGSEISRRRTRG